MFESRWQGMSRRGFIEASALAGVGAGLGSLGVVGRALAQDGVTPTPLDGKAVRFRPEIEPVVRWLEETPRERILERVVAKLRGGWSYRDLMAGVFLAGIRNIQPRPVGFKFHAVMVVHAAHQLGMSATVDEWLIPMLWAVDTFKASQERDVREGDWTLGPANEQRLPRASDSREAFRKAMDAWDPEAADAAAIALARSHSAAAVMEAFWPYSIRDQRNIGHKAIFAAQAFRTLQTIGWQHAEPVLRSLAYGLLDRQGKPGVDVVGPWEQNQQAADHFSDDWMQGVPDIAASDGLMSELRGASPAAAGASLLEYVQGGIAPAGIWDGILKAANELLLRKPGIVSLHSVTSVNALHTIFLSAADDATRRLSLLQAASWVALFRDALGEARALNLQQLEPLETPADPREALADIFATIGASRDDAARKTLGFLSRGGDAEAVFAAARRQIFVKANDSHDFKFGATAWEEALLASTPATQARLVAGMMGHLPASTAPDSPLMAQARAAAAAAGASTPR